MLLALAGLASFGAAWPALRRLVSPNVFLGSGIETWGAAWGWMSALALLAILTARHDAWMGSLVGWLALTPILFTEWRAEILLVAILALALVESRHATARERGMIVTGLSYFGLVEAGYVLLQWAGFDPLVDGFHRSYTPTPGGTFAHEGAAGGFLALTGLVAPAWMFALIVPALVATRCRAALLAFLVGLFVRYGPLPRVAQIVCVIAALAAVFAMTRAQDPLAGAKLRAYVQGHAVMHMLTTAPVTGLGFLRWNESKHVVKIPPSINGTDATLNPLHNDLVQWSVETGLPGMALALGGLVALTRRIARGACWAPTTPALAGAFILTLTWYPLHMVPTGAVILTLLGLSTPLPTQGA